MNDNRHKKICIDLDGIVRPLSREGEKVMLEIDASKKYGGGGIAIIGRVIALDDNFITFSSSDFCKRYFLKESKRVTQKQIDQFFDEMVTESFIEYVKGQVTEYYLEKAA